MKSALVSAVAALCMSACGLDDGFGRDEDPPTRAEQITSQINRVAPPLAGATRLAIDAARDSFHARGERLAITIPHESSGWVQLEQTGQENRIGVRLPFADLEKQGVVAMDGTVTYQGGIQAIDVAVQAFDHGVRIQVVLNDETAPSQFVYAIGAPAGGQLVLADNGGVLIFDAQGAFRGGLAAPWAFDSRHHPVPTHYEVHGHTIVQVVEHEGSSFEYPIVADPWLGQNLISSVTWSYSSSGWTMKVSPTAWARTWGTSSLSYSVGVAGWAELSSAYYVGTNPGGFQDQYICHQQYAFFKNTWNLDEWRPDVSYAATVAAACNP